MLLGFFHLRELIAITPFLYDSYNQGSVPNSQANPENYIKLFLYIYYIYLLEYILKFNRSLHVLTCISKDLHKYVILKRHK